MTGRPGRAGPLYDHDVLISRAIEKYDGKTSGAKDYRQLGAVLPENCDVTDVGGKLYVRLFARNVQTGGLVAEYEVVDHEPILRDMHRTAAPGSPAEANPETWGLSEDETATLVSMGLVSIAAPRPDGSYPDRTRLWLTTRGRDVFYALVDHARELDFYLG